MSPGTRTLLATPVLAVLVIATPARSAPDLDLLYSTVAPRAAALGGADAAGPADATAAFGNPASLAFLAAPGFAAGHRVDAPGRVTQSGALAWRSPTGSGGIALRARLGNRDGTAAADAIARPRAPDAGWRAGGAAAFIPWRNFAVGIAVDRFKTLPVAAPRVIGWSADAGIAWQAARTRAGIFFRGLTWEPASGERRAWSAAVAQDVVRGAGIVLQADGDGREAPRLGGGLAVAAGRGLEVRAGARDAGAGRRWMTAGFGLGTTTVRLDYAVRAAAGARTEHQAAVVLGFGVAPVLHAGDHGAPSRAIAPGAAVPPALRSPALDEAPSTAQTQSPAPGAMFVVRAGPFKSLEAAAHEVTRLYEATLHPTMEHDGELYFVRVQRCASQAEATAWQKRAADAGVRCEIAVEPIPAVPGR